MAMNDAAAAMGPTVLSLDSAVVPPWPTAAGEAMSHTGGVTGSLDLDADLQLVPDAPVVAVLAHPHPHYGGDRFHPFVDGMFEALPKAGVAAVRFDFSSADPGTARAEIVAAIDHGVEEARAADGRDEPPRAVLCGYSFGAAMAAGIDDPRVAGWYLLAPPVVMLGGAAIGADHRPKIIVVPAHDQFSSPAAVADVTDAWRSTEVTVLDGADHSLVGAIARVVDDGCAWIAALAVS